MDSGVKQCNLLYKKELGPWIEEKVAVKDFDPKKLRQIQKIAWAKDEGDMNTFSCQDWLGKLDYNLEDPTKLFNFVDRENNLTTFNLISLHADVLHASNTDCLTLTENPDDQGSKWITPRVYNIIWESMNNCRFLAHSFDGHIFVIDWLTKTGRVVGKWPVPICIVKWEDIEYTTSGRITDEHRDTSLRGAISTDGTKVALIDRYASYDNDTDGLWGQAHYVSANGDTLDIPSDGHPTIGKHFKLRLFNISTKQWCSRKVPRDRLLSIESIYNGQLPALAFVSSMTFHPIRTNLVYLMVKDDYEDEYGDTWAIVLYDIQEEEEEGTILATRGRLLMASHASRYYFNFNNKDYNTLDGPTFLHHGNIIVSFHLLLVECGDFGCDYVVLLDAFNLDILASVKLRHSLAPIAYNFAVSTSQREIAVFARNANDVDEVEVYEIPFEPDMSLKNLCRERILQSVGKNRVDMLTMLPLMLREYLNFCK